MRRLHSGGSSREAQAHVGNIAYAHQKLAMSTGRRQGRAQSSSCHIATAAITKAEPTEEPSPPLRCNYSISNRYHNTGIILLAASVQCLLAAHSPFAMPQSVQCPSAAVARTGMDVFTQPRVFVTLNMTVVQACRLGHVPPDR